MMEMTDKRAQNIDKRWKKNDGRTRLAELLMLNPDNGGSRQKVDSFLDALLRLVRTRRRTMLVGFGVFEWRRWKHPIPTGKTVETWRLAFKPSKYVRGRKWK